MGRAASFVAVAALACGAAWCRPALAERPPRTTPASADTVVERLPRGYAALEPSARPRPKIEQVQVLLSTAARTGDTRLAARAEGLLAVVPATSRAPGLLMARAFAAQHRHDFDGAVRWLDTAVRADPRDGSARLSRAQIRLVQGRLDLARRDCTALALGIDMNAGMLCAAALAERRGDTAQAGRLLDALLAQRPRGEVLRSVLVTRGEVAAREGEAGFDRWFEQALAIDRNDVRTLAAYARALRAQGRDQDVLALLRRAPTTDALSLQATLSAHRLQGQQAVARLQAQGRRYALAHSVGMQPEMRDEAEYWLTLRGDPDRALALAQRNFAVQRDVEDVDILIRSARAAGRPEALANLRRWAATQQIALPAGASQ